MSRRSKRLRADDGRASRSSPGAAQQSRSGPAGSAHLASGLGNGAVAATLQGNGQALDDRTRLTMQTAFGADFSDVRVHTSADADDSAHDLSARAVTRGSDIAFRSGMYNPQTPGGRGLLAHELAHVLQQRGASRNDSATPNGATALEGEARGASRAMQAGAQTIPVSQPAVAPAVQCDGLWDYVPGAETVASLAGDAWSALGRVDASTINGAVERALGNRVLRGLLLSNPVFAPHAMTLEFLAASPGALQAIWSFVWNPKPKIDELQDKLRPHIMHGVSIARTQSEGLLRSLGVPEPHVATAGRVLQGAAQFGLAAAEFVLDEVIVDTIAFHQLYSERQSYSEAWQKYDAGLIDTHDIIVEHLSFALSVLGRIEDIISVILWIAGIVGGGAAGGTVGSAVPVAGTAAGAGGGGAAGGGAGIAASEVVGIIASLGPATLEVERMVKAAGDLLLAEQSDEQRNEDYGQIAAGAITLAVIAVLAFIPGLAMRLGRRLARKIRGMLPEIATLLPSPARMAPATPATRATSQRQPAGTTEAPVPAVQAERAAAAPNAGRREINPAEAAPRNNVRAFPAERVTPAQTRETPGELVEGRLGPRPRHAAEPPNVEAAQRRPDVEYEELRTGTGDVMYREVPRGVSQDAARASTGGPAQGPSGTVTSAGPTVAPSPNVTRTHTGGGGGGRRGGGGGGAGGGGRRRGRRRPPVNSAREQLTNLLGNLNVPDARIDEISVADARNILRAPMPPQNEPRARDIWRYLAYKYRGRGAQNSSRGLRLLNYRDWSRRSGLRQQQRARRRADRPNERRRSERPQEAVSEPADPEALIRGPRTTAEATEELATGAQSRTQRDREATSIAGNEMERGPARRQLEQVFGPVGDVLSKRRFPRWLRRAYRNAGVEGPDYVIIIGRRVVILDSVPGPRGDHLAKTQRDVNIANEAAAQRGLTAEGREFWWTHTETPEDVLPPSELARMRQEFSEEFGARPIDPETFRTAEEGFDEALDLPQFSRPILPTRED